MDSVHMLSGTNGDTVGHNSESSNLVGDIPEDSRPCVVGQIKLNMA